MTDKVSTLHEQVKESGLRLQRAAKHDPGYKANPEGKDVIHSALDPGSSFPEKPQERVQPEEEDAQRAPFRGSMHEPVKYHHGGEKEPHTMGVDKVQGMNQALGEANTFLTRHGRHKTSQGVGPYKPDELPL